MTNDFSSETVEVKRQWKVIFNVPKRKNLYQPRILFLGKIFLTNCGELKHYHLRKTETVYYQWACITRNTERSTLGYRETEIDGK